MHLCFIYCLTLKDIFQILDKTAKLYLSKLYFLLIKYKNRKSICMNSNISDVGNWFSPFGLEF